MRIIIVVIALLAGPALAHDDAEWIRAQGLKNRMGEMCCGPQDCNAVDPARVKLTDKGYAINQGSWTEVIPYSEPMPFSIDGRIWICRSTRYMNNRLCVFDRPGSM